MNEQERKLSDYIDSLNQERKPKEHDFTSENPEMKELLETVRLVRGLNEPVLPNKDYPKKLALALKSEVIKKKIRNKAKRNWFLGVASIVAVFVLFMVLNYVTPFGKPNMVYAMEKAYQDVKAYHGLLEIVETNAEGKATTQAKVEVWADQEGHYYVKELVGSQEGLITVNDGKKKWQVQPQQKEVDIFPAFPDSYNFTFELGREIDDIKNALITKEIGKDKVAGRAAVILEVTPQGGNPYKIWVDQETKMPLQKQMAMQYALQYKVSYTKINFREEIPKELLAYSVPQGFEEINSDPEQLVSSLEEAKKLVGFTPKLPQNVLDKFSQNSIAVDNDLTVVKLNYTSLDNKKQIVILQSKAKGNFKPSAMASLGKINNKVAEIQVPLQAETGVLGGGPYAGSTDLNSVRWQQENFEYAVIGNASLAELEIIIKGLAKGPVELQTPKEDSLGKPQVEVPVDLEIEKGDQKNADSGHSPWKLDPAFVTQVFVSLQISPAGIQGEYPIKMEELTIIKNTGTEALMEVKGPKTPIQKVYLKRLIRQDPTGIWTVVGYDPVENKR